MPFAVICMPDAGKTHVVPRNLAIMESCSDPTDVVCVDLDGTLIHTDLLYESALALLARKPYLALLFPWWLMRGKAYLKRQIASRIEFDPALLPYNTELLSWLQQQSEHRTVVLCTASDERLAQAVADHVGVFDEVISSNGSLNMAGRNKARHLVERFGAGGFVYAGNARVDLEIWRHARAAIVVESGQRLSQAASKFTKVSHQFPRPAATFRTWLKALRIHQWVKNSLIFLPLLAAHRIFDAVAVERSVIAFICFGLCASSVYLTNDLLDLTSDRQHPRKRKRPFAAGTLQLSWGPFIALAMLAASMVIAWFLGTSFLLVLIGYYLLTTAYSLRFKRIVMLDVVVLAMLYTTRILAGSAAIRTFPSFWLLAFSMFIFLSLAMVKRYTELLMAQKQGQVTARGRGYDVEDIPLIQSLGGASGYLAVLVLALYINSSSSQVLYHHPHYLWLLCPLLLYWISRVWAIAHRGIMHDDPVVFAFMDNVSRVLLVLAGIIIVISVI